MTPRSDATPPAAVPPPHSPLFTQDQLLTFLAWEAGEISEGQAVKLLAVDPVTARDMKLIAISAGVALAYRRLVKKAPEAEDAKVT
jgi:hypothetical protein